MPNAATAHRDAATSGDIAIIRDVARRYAELVARDSNAERRSLWRRHNSLERVERVPIHIRAFAWSEMPEATLQCTDAALRSAERHMRMALKRASFKDDTMFESWVPVRAAQVLPGEGSWGPGIRWTENRAEGGAGVHDAPLKSLEDIEKVIPAPHRIDEQRTSRRLNRVREAIGDIVTVVADRAPIYCCPAADISNDVAMLRGLEQILWDMYDHPEWLHRLLGIMRDGILENQRGAEAAGDWRLLNHDDQAVSYARELPDPSADESPVKRRQLWGRFAAQEFTSVGPAQWDEFMLRYQEPIMANFGLVTYGCCEEMSSRIPLLKRVPNLRRIAVTPVSDAAKCAELIGDQYVASYRPSPADMVSYKWDGQRVRKILKRDLAAFKANNCIVDITLKDVETVENDPDRVAKWVQVARHVCEEVF
jgi:hypothetical protein